MIQYLVCRHVSLMNGMFPIVDLYKVSLCRSILWTHLNLWTSNSSVYFTSQASYKTVLCSQHAFAYQLMACYISFHYLLIHVCFYVTMQGRIMLPLNVTSDDGPIYVNAKQYNGIIRRRQSRAKAVLGHKLIKRNKV